MALVYLNGEYCPPEQAAISPMDRGFLFGDGLYEVIPCYHRTAVGFNLHLQRLAQGLAAIDIAGAPAPEQWRSICDRVLGSHTEQHLGLYLQVSRGVTPVRGHAFPTIATAPTVFVYAFAIAAPRPISRDHGSGYRVVTQRDQRWQHCDVKTTSLLGNVLHYQHGRNHGADETLLFNSAEQLTEASTANVFVLHNDTVFTAPLDHQLLPGVTRHILLDLLRRDGRYRVVEQAVSREQLAVADEVWITSSSREVVPVVAIDDVPVGDGKIGDGWLYAYTLYSNGKFDY